VTGWLEHPAINVPSALNPTAPRIGEPIADTTVATKVTLSPCLDGFIDDDTVVVVATRFSTTWTKNPADRKPFTLWKLAMTGILPARNDGVQRTT
jgi:hypothetical protein